MKNVFNLLVLLLFFGMIVSCEKDDDRLGKPIDDETSVVENEIDNTLISKETIWLQALSKWVATPEAKQWLLDKSGLAKNGEGSLDEVLVLEILCGSEGRNFADIYSQYSRTTYSAQQLSDEIYAENAMLSIKYDAYFDDYLGTINNFTPLMSDKNRDNNFMGGQPYDAREVLRETGGALVIGFRLVEAENTVLYDPANNMFNQPLGYPFCNEHIFAERIREFKDPICTGEIPLSVTEDVQRIFYEVCGGDFPINFGGGDEICDNGIDDDGDGLVDCADPDCCGTCGTCGEVCDNGIDDDGDGLVDGEDDDCINQSPCMRDHYIEDNFFYEMELSRPNSITGPGGNLCNGVQRLEHNPFGTGILTYGARLFPEEFDNLGGLEEWYDFLIVTHWGTATGTAGAFQELVYRFHIWELVNEPVFHLEFHSGGTQGTGGGGGAAILIVDEVGITETLPVSLEMVPFYAASDICGINNWNPAVFGDKVAFSIHEGDNCILRTTDGTVETTVTNHTYTSAFSINLGLGQFATPYVTGGIMYQYTDVLATTETNSISSTYTTSFSDDYYMGRVNYSYCWEDQGTIDQIHEIDVANQVNLRILSRICE